MKQLTHWLGIFSLVFLPYLTQAQIDEDQLGAWYMYFWNTDFGDRPWGLQGDVQYRNWNIAGGV